MAVKNKIQFTDKERGDFADSWTKSVEESCRLISYISELSPHKIKHTTSLNDVRRSIIALSRPMAELTKTIQDNINLVKDKQKEALTENMTMEELSKKLHVPAMDLEAIQLGYPRTVCTASKCISVIAVGDNEKKEYKKEFKTVCHDQCQITTDKDIVGCPELQHCCAMLPSEGSTCRECGCPWFAHMHITYETKQVSTKIVDKNIQQLLSDKKSAVEAISLHKKQLEEVIKELETENVHLVNVSARLACFLRHNAICPVNDAIGDYMDLLIDSEKGKVAVGGNPTALDNLKQTKQAYLQEIGIIEDAMKRNVADDQQLDVNEIEKLIAGLYKLKTAGPKLEKIMKVADKAHDKAAFDCEKVVVVNKPGLLSAITGPIKSVAAKAKALFSF